MGSLRVKEHSDGGSDGFGVKVFGERSDNNSIATKASSDPAPAHAELGSSDGVLSLEDVSDSLAEVVVGSDVIVDSLNSEKGLAGLLRSSSLNNMLASHHIYNISSLGYNVYLKSFIHDSNDSTLIIKYKLNTMYSLKK